LQNWALGFTNDEELDEAYFGETSPSGDNCNGM
uniref:DUF1281_C domain-containing protein n=1 Tax=Anisakis simplex TaxID=6269 RepID=A0A0M3JAG3_ANISI